MRALGNILSAVQWVGGWVVGLVSEAIVPLSRLRKYCSYKLIIDREILVRLHLKIISEQT